MTNFHLSGIIIRANSTNTNLDASSPVQTLVFGVSGGFLALTAAIIAFLQLRRMKQHSQSSEGSTV
jgi:hypothetical protein